MTTVTYTWSELEAHRLVRRGYSISTTSDLAAEVKDAADKIILLAERIKQDRIYNTMQMVANLEQR